jgi:hypothetical protein
MGIFPIPITCRGGGGQSGRIRFAAFEVLLCDWNRRDAVTGVFMGERLSKPRVYETLLFIALLSGPPRLRERDPFASLAGNADWSVLLNAAVFGLAAFWVFLNLGGYLLKRKAIPRFGPLPVLAFVLAGCLYLSLLVSPSPVLTFYRVSQIPIAVLFGFFWVRRFGVDSTLKHLLAGYLTMCIAIVVCAFVAPDLVYTDDTLVRDTRLRGDAIANTGAVAAMGLILLLGYPFALKNRLIKASMVGFLIALLALAETRAAFIVVLLFVLLACLLLPRSTPLRTSLYALLTLIPLLSILGWTSRLFGYVIRDPSSVRDMSDRLPLWHYTVSAVMEESPLIGLGFYANREITTAYNSGLGTSHSAFIEIFSGGGILAIVAFGILIAVALYLALRLLPSFGANPRVFVIVNLLFATLLVGVTSEETVIASPTSFTFWILLSLIPAVTRTVYNQAQRGYIGASQKSSSGPRVLPATRR